MKLIAVVALAFVAIATAAPAAPAETIPILRSAFDSQPDGSYVFSYETGDGTQREETGELKDVLDEDKKTQQVVVVRGSFSYLDENNTPVFIKFTADETGYHPEGESIPKVPAARR